MMCAVASDLVLTKNVISVNWVFFFCFFNSEGDHKIVYARVIKNWEKISYFFGFSLERRVFYYYYIFLWRCMLEGHAFCFGFLVSIFVCFFWERVFWIFVDWFSN
jgi:TM2 domain-containing membrane protein YozV